MAGGHATYAGTQFQAGVAAWLAAHVLAATVPRGLGLGAGIALTSIYLETAAPIDDILVDTSQGGLCLINVKTKVESTAQQDSSLASAIDQFVRQYLQSKHGRGNRRWERPLDVERDRLVLAVDARKSGGFADIAQALIGRVKETGSLTADDVATTIPQRSLLGHIRDLIAWSWTRHTGDDPATEEIIALLCLVRVIALDLNGRDADYAEQLLRTTVVNGESAAAQAWKELNACCQSFAESRSGGERDTLLGKLREVRIPLQTVPDFRLDIERLRQVTEETLRSLDHLAHLRVPDSDKPLTIHRPCASALASHAATSSFLLIGEPGAGKSGALHAAALNLQQKGHPVVVLAVDRHSVNTLGELRNDLQLNHTLTEVLARWSIDKPGILFVDALDASRGGPSDTVFRQLLQQVMDIPGWHVVASIRRFDLQFGVAYHDLFAGPPIDAGFVDDTFPDVRHLLVRKLSDEELDQVWRDSSAMREAYAAAGPDLRTLLRSPFNLFLMSGILRSGGIPGSSIYTQVQLLNRYWKWRVVGSDDQGYGRERVLADAASSMLDRRTLSVPVSRLGPEADQHLPTLQSEEVLRPSKGRTVAFSHHMLFDYAVARLILEMGHADDFAERLTTSDDHALMLAPAAIMVFQLLWEEDESHATFWKVAISVAGASGVGAFCRMLPARVVASLVRTPTDVAGLVERLSEGNGPETAAARFLVVHCFGTLLAGVVSQERVITDPGSPWPAIARQMIESDKTGGTWPWKAVVSQWSERPEEIAPEHEADVNTLARHLLLRAMGTGDESSIISGIPAVARTLRAATAESEAVLRRLLMPERVAAQKYRELYWLAHELNRLAGPCPALAVDLYRAAFCAQLPSRDEPSPLGDSRILPLTSNKRQDFESIRWELSEKFASFMSAHPGAATSALLDAVDYHIRHEENRTVEEAVTFTFGTYSSTYIPDWSGVWWDHEDRGDHDSSAIGLLNCFVNGLEELAENPASIEEVCSRVAAGPGWACTWTALLRVARQKPEAFADTVLPLLTEPAIIESMDSRHTAGSAIAVCHPVLTPEQRERIERAILQTTQENSKLILLGCLKPENIVTHEAAEARREMEAAGPLPENRPLITFSGWVKTDEDWLVKKLGLDNSRPDQAAVFEAVSAVDSTKDITSTDAQARQALANCWKHVMALHSRLLEHNDLPENLGRHAWEVLSRTLHKVAEACDEPQHLEVFPRLLDMVLDVLDKAPWPSHDPDPEEEARFARSPGWGSAPRVDAAGALMAWARVADSLSDALRAQLRDLAQDASPAVRYQVLGRVNTLLQSAPEFMWDLCSDAFACEKNKGVLGFFLAACRPILSLRPEWLAERILPIEQRYEAELKERRMYGKILVDLVLNLWLVHEQKAAGDRAQEWVQSPLDHHEQVLEALHLLRNALIQGDTDRADPFDERVRSAAIAFFRNTVEVTAPQFKELAIAASQNEERRQEAEKALRILDSSMQQIFFASGAHDAKKVGNAQKVLSDKARRRFLDEIWPILEVLATVAYPSVTHYFLKTLEYFIPDAPARIFQLLVHGLTHGGEHGGYQRESLGADLFVRIVRRYLADHLNVLAGDPIYRRGLITMLDQFVQVGWPEARRLVYELPEMLR